MSVFDRRLGHSFQAVAGTAACLTLNQLDAPSQAQRHEENPMKNTRWKIAFAALLWANSLPLWGQVPGAPFEAFAGYGPGSGYVVIPNNPSLNPTTGITMEAWVQVDNEGAGCPTIVGKGYQQNWWLGYCSGRLGAYIGGEGHYAQGAGHTQLEPGLWTHVAVTSDGTHRRYYKNGSLIDEISEPGTLTPNNADVWIGRDSQWTQQFEGSMDEVRLWNRALSMEELRRYANFGIQSKLDGLVAVWASGPTDALGEHPGSIMGQVLSLAGPPGSCTTTSSEACLLGRYSVSIDWQTNSEDGEGVVVPPASTDTALFWFFHPENWEVMVKIIEACGLNDRVWVYIAASTDQGYEVKVVDHVTRTTKVYNKAIGPPAPAITDTQALDVCNPF